MPDANTPSAALFRRFAARRARGTARPGDARRHNALLAAIVLPPVLVMLVLALTQEPLRGDLTRPGGYTEAQYGWNAPQERFAPPLASERYDRPFDVVVFGDSFSANPVGQTDPGAYWTNHLAQRTGLSVVTVNRSEEMTFARFLRHPVFLHAPPRLLIVESVERYLLRDYAIEADARTGVIERSCRPQARELPPLPTPRPIEVEPVPWTRDTAPAIDFDQAANYLWKVVLRDVLGVETTRVIRLALTRPDLFSNRASGALLVYDDEVRKASFATAEAVEAMYCTLIDIQNAAEANGRTRFLFMAAPDKLSAYAGHLADAELRALSLLPELYARPALNQVQLLEALREAVGRGVKDVYLPNDTHWGTPGHRVVADSVVESLANPAQTHLSEAQGRGPRRD